MVGRPKGTGGKARALTREEVKRIDLCLTGTKHEWRNRTILYLGLGSGMRIGEMCGLRVRDVYAYGAVLSQVVLEKHSTKSKESRTVHVSRQAQKRLGDYLDHKRADLGRDIDPEAPLFPSGRRLSYALTPSSASTVVQNMFKAAGISGAKSHSLRRTHANSLRRSGADYEIIRTQLGHSSLETTMRYFEVDPFEVESVVGDLKF